MLSVSITEFMKRTQFYLNKIKAGETVIIGEKENPIAKLTPILDKPNKNRPMGLAEGDFVVPDDFDAPLPMEVLNLFEKQ